jgi:hypothetical protein
MHRMSSDTEFCWFHLILTTYAAWLPGDPRGFRTRHHRDHVEGDYKHPPPEGLYDGLHRAARANQKEPMVTLTEGQRKVIANALWDKLERLGSTVAIIRVSARHSHVLTKSPPQLTRHWAGIIKRHATYTLKEHGWNQRLWAKGEKLIRIPNRQHQLNAFGYIQRHVNEGAFILTYLDRSSSPAKPAEGSGGSDPS